MNKNEIEFALNKTWNKKDFKKSTLKKITDIKMAQLFSIYGYSQSFVLDFLVNTIKKDESHTRKRIKKFIEDCKSCGIDIDKYSRVKESKPRTEKKALTKSQEIVKKLSPMLDFWNIDKKSVSEQLESVRGGTPFSEEAILESYKTLYLLYMAKARGETVTRKTSTAYEIEVLENGKFKKTLSKNKVGKRILYEETQSHLPDEKAFAMALVVMEVIERMESGDKAYATNDELEDMYADYINDVKRQKVAYKGKEYTDAELIEEDDE